MNLSLPRPIYIFVGASAHGAGIAPFVPEIHLRPPVRRYDLGALPVDRSGTIILVDGIFHSQQSVSLTEIRDAIAKGWIVVGLSSMGALRAVEARPLGMVGFGRVFRWLSLFKVEEDDEVAQILDPDSFEALSDAMVDLRYFLRGLERDGCISRKVRASILRDLKSMFYPKRNLRLILDSPHLSSLGNDSRQRVAELAKSHIGLKQLDFRDLVRSLERSTEGTL